MRWMLVRMIIAAAVTPHSARIRLMALAGVQMGRRPRVLCGFQITDGNVILGDDVFISESCYFEDHATITIGDGTWIGAHSHLVTGTHAIGQSGQRAGEWRAEPIRIGNGCWLGTSVTVLPGVTVGNGCVIGAGALVNRDCLPDGLYVGVPATRRRDL